MPSWGIVRDFWRWCWGGLSLGFNVSYKGSSTKSFTKCLLISSVADRIKSAVRLDLFGSSIEFRFRSTRPFRLLLSIPITFVLTLGSFFENFSENLNGGLYTTCSLTLSFKFVVDFVFVLLGDLCVAIKCSGVDCDLLIMLEILEACSICEAADETIGDSNNHFWTFPNVFVWLSGFE